MIYQICNGNVNYASVSILKNINFEIRNKEKIAIIGRNGCGKTTLLKLIAGLIPLDKLDSDEDSYIRIDGQPTIGFLQQISFEDMNRTVEEELLAVFEPIIKLQEQLNDIISLMERDSSEQVLKRYSDLQMQFEVAGGYSFRQDLDTIFTKFGFPTEDLKRSIASFSGGQQTKIAFVKLLLTKPDIMLLDEPTNHLDMPTIEWLEGYLKTYPKAVVIVSHDRMFLDKVADVVYEIEYKGMKRYPGNYTAYVKMKRENWEKQQKDYIAQQKEIERLNTIVEKYKNTPTKVSMTRSKLKVIEHMDRIDAPDRYDLKSFHATFSPRLEGGKDVLKVNKLQIGYDSVLSEVSFEVKKGQKVAIIGANGIGKSTLLKTLTGNINALGGSFSYGFQIEPGYYDQQLTQYSSSKTVIDEFWDEYPELTQTEVRTALGHFLFTKDDVFKTVTMLSGGEKVRLYLAKLFRKRPNFLILDEPTNHMDIIGKETLENMIKNFPGAVLCVSHDRYFVKEIADALLVFEPEGVTFYPYGYDTFLEKSSTAKNVNSSSSLTLNEPSGIGKQASSGIKLRVSNPGKETAKREQLLNKLERLIEESEQRIKGWKEQMDDPSNASDYIRLEELQHAIQTEESKLEDNLGLWSEVNE